MRNKKNTVIVLLAALLCVIVLASSFGSTFAYLTDQETKNNTLTVGETKTEIVEEFTPPKKLEPGVSFTKKPSVNNTGNLPCYVRMRADFSDSQMEDLCEELDINTTDWEYDAADGYYYYKLLLEPGKMTSPLFTTVTVRTVDANGEKLTDAQMKDFDILIYAESTQHVDHAGNHPTDEYKTIWN